MRLVFTVGLIASLSSIAMADDDVRSLPPGQRQLFLDDVDIERIDNVTRTMHQPVKRGVVIVPDQPWETTLQVRCAPVWDERASRFKIWMITSTPVDGVAGTTYAESRDGLKWEKPVLRQWKYQGSLDNNFIGLEVDSAWPANAIENVAYDPHDEDPQRRFKGFLGALDRIPIASPDGIHWSRLKVSSLPSQDESNLSYDPILQQFIATLKISGPFGRSHAIWLSCDFQKWRNTGILIHADAEDQRLAKENIHDRIADKRLQPLRYDNPSEYNADIYNVGVFRYENLYIGLPAVFHTTGKSDGFHLIQLISSRDLRTWQRQGDRKPFIGPSPAAAGAYDLTQLLPPSSPIIRDDELWFFYTGTRYREEPIEPDSSGRGAICLAVLRRDGFMSLDADGQGGTITTKPFKWTGRRLVANAKAQQQGQIYAEVLDEVGNILATSQPLKGDQPRGEFQWNEGALESLLEKSVRLRFRLRNASIYAYWLDH